MLQNEEHVIAQVCRFLVSTRCSITKICGAKEKGVDIDALSPDGKLRIAIEAKGETRVKADSMEGPKPFHRSTVYSAVATAYFCASVRASEGCLAGIALPKNNAYSKQIAPLLPSLKKLGIEVFWSLPNGAVEIAGHWSVWYAWSATIGV